MQSVDARDELLSDGGLLLAAATLDAGLDYVGVGAEVHLKKKYVA